MNSKKWCIIAAMAAVAAFLSVPFLNVAVDPFGVFGSDWYSYTITQNPRVSKIEYLKEHHSKYDSYIIGCSSTSSYPVEALNRYLDAKFYNMIMYGGDMYDVEQTVYYLAENYEVKNLVVNLYLTNGIEYNTEPDQLTNSMHADVTGDGRWGFYVKYAAANPKYSFAKLSAGFKDKYLAELFDVFDEETGAYDKRERDAEKVSDLEAFYEDYPAFLNYPSWTSYLPKHRECGESLLRVRNFCDEKGIRLIVVNAPVYHDKFDDFPKEEIMKYYRSIAESVDFWDFSLSSVSYDPRFFYDETHFRNDVGEMALGRVFGDKSIYIPEDFGRLVTRDTVEAYVNSLYGKSFSDEGYTKKLPVLLYKDIDGGDESVSLQTFERHMTALSENGYTAVLPEDIIRYIEKGSNLPEKAVLITLEGGSVKWYEKAYPVLKRLGLRAVVFAEGELLGKVAADGLHFGAEEQKVMEKAGVIDVQSRSYAQAGVDGSGNMLMQKGESEEEYVQRLQEDCKKWSVAMGKEPLAVAFPQGDSTLLTQAVLDGLGVPLSFSEEEKADTLLKGVGLSGHSLGRYTVTDEMNAEQLLDMLKNI